MTNRYNYLSYQTEYYESDNLEKKYEREEFCLEEIEHKIIDYMSYKNLTKKYSHIVIADKLYVYIFDIMNMVPKLISKRAHTEGKGIKLLEYNQNSLLWTNRERNVIYITEGWKEIENLIPCKTWYIQNKYTVEKVFIPVNCYNFMLYQIYNNEDNRTKVFSFGLWEQCKLDMEGKFKYQIFDTVPYTKLLMYNNNRGLVICEESFYDRRCYQKEDFLMYVSSYNDGSTYINASGQIVENFPDEKISEEYISDPEFIENAYYDIGYHIEKLIPGDELIFRVDFDDFDF